VESDKLNEGEREDDLIDHGKDLSKVNIMNSDADGTPRLVGPPRSTSVSACLSLPKSRLSVPISLSGFHLCIIKRKARNSLVIYIRQAEAAPSGENNLCVTL